MIYKLKCTICRKKVERKINLKRAVCDACKHKYKKKGSKEKKMRNTLIVDLRIAGFSCKKIGEMCKITRQRVWQILKKYKKEE